MSKKRHKRHADKREAGGFVPLPHAVLRSKEFCTLSRFALKALMDLLAQYRGDNNGDLCAAWSLMTRRGWRSRDSLAKGLRELRDTDFLIVTRQGGRHKATLYGVSFYEIDWCSGKLDITAPTRGFMGSWRKTPVAVAPILRRVESIPLSRPASESPQDCTADRAALTKAA